MTSDQIDLFEVSENIGKNSERRENQAILEPFISEPPRTATCVICGGEFAAATSRANSCSDACRRERRLRYGAAYRQQGRQARQQLLDMFGGRRPTGDELLQMLKTRKGNP
ncbi:MAG: hypothetical protein KJ947_22570 [Alphaproteobacteria bacterium]|mgnify:CR=1 FL=1|nr:hypothetical protein [Alphaproteobacteria bacterium]MBU1552331.1 hypothetical protein [Alphaproteobacteria bacterium]MBU2334524.1 hypothetical protein [Alphaproteobacteria bacterium]MBU2386379.1 hypothetical protein [Alphaproteobacteria bacterium]|tara:strand:- start:127 stop:459 length:333 start_codon:yes stop_codon:yes gene_type:complete